LLRWDNLFDADALPRYAFISIASCLVYIAWCLYALRNKNAIVYHPLIYLLIVYLCWAGLSFLWSVDPSATTQSLLSMSAFFILIFLAIQISYTPENIKILIIVSVSAGTLISLLGLMQLLGFEPFSIQQTKPPASTFGNKNHAAQYLDLIVPLSLILVFTEINRSRYWLLSLALGCNIAYLLNTYSRGSWLAFAVVLMVLVYILIKNQPARAFVIQRFPKRKIPLLIAIIIPVIFSVLAVNNAKDQIEEKLSVNSSVDVRLKSYANAVAAIADNSATGIGHGAFMLGYRKYMFTNAPLIETNETLYLVNLHNDFLQEFVELGIGGGILFLIIYLWLLLLCWRNTVNHSDSTNIYAIGILLALIAFGTHALVSFPLHRPTSAMEFWLLAGLAMGISDRRPTLSKTLGHTVKIISLIAVSLLLTYSVYYYVHYFKNSAQVLMLKERLAAQNCSSALNIASNLDYKQSYDTKIYVPLVYNICYAIDREKSFQKMNEVLAYDPYSSLARITRGALLLEMNQPAEAADDFLNVVTVLPHRPTAYVGLGHAAVNMGKTQLATEMYQKALSLDANNQAALDMLEKLGDINK
jgi:O-antigen ligase